MCETTINNKTGTVHDCGPNRLSDKDRLHPPKVGTIIVYKFQELTNSGVPRFPSYVGKYSNRTLYCWKSHATNIHVQLSLEI